MKVILQDNTKLITLDLTKDVTGNYWLRDSKKNNLVNIEGIDNKWILKSNIKSLKAKGKMGYSPVSEIEFYDESFVEITPDNKTEQKYSAIERVSVITDKVVYIHVNNVMSYILPLSCFESKEQYNNFLDFVRSKCANIDVYK